MPELLLIPPWNGSPRSLADWVALFEKLGQTPDVDKDGNFGAVIMLEPIGAEGYAEIESNGRVSALNLEFEQALAEPARALVEAAATEFGWEIIEDNEPDEGD